MIRPLCFNHTDGSVVAFTTERGVAVRFDPYSAFNCCDYTGDSPAHVEACRAELCRRLGVAESSLVTARQVHGDVVATVDTGILGMEAAARRSRLDGVDGLVTNVPGVVLGVFTADCVPVLLCDSAAGVVAAVHAGWKGTVRGIVKRAVERMCALGASVSAVQAVFGPSICRGCFEVGDEVVEMFERHGFPMERLTERDRATGKAHIDLAEANAWLLGSCGVPSGNIAFSGLCTKCIPERFFSARVLGTDSGRLLTGICLR